VASITFAKGTILQESPDGIPGFEHSHPVFVIADQPGCGFDDRGTILAAHRTAVHQDDPPLSRIA
jgi:hypothetical protein